MNICNVSGHFGNIRGREFTFRPGLNRLVMKNEEGKSTLCALLRVMFYGLSTSRRDTKNTLSDKTKYAPLDQAAFSGRVELEFQGRRIVIERKTGKGGEMQEFSAYDPESGEECLELAAKTAGETLFGVNEKGFVSSLLIDGTDMAVTSGEIYNKIASLASGGDASAAYTEALRRLDRQRLDLDSGNGHGVKPRLAAQLQETRDAIRRMESLEQDLADAAEKEQESVRRLAAIREKQEALAAACRDSAVRDAAEKRLRQSRESLPEARQIQESVMAARTYEALLAEEKERRASRGMRKKRAKIPLAVGAAFVALGVLLSASGLQYGMALLCACVGAGAALCVLWYQKEQALREEEEQYAGRIRGAYQALRACGAQFGGLEDVEEIIGAAYSADHALYRMQYEEDVLNGRERLEDSDAYQSLQRQYEEEREYLSELRQDIAFLKGRIGGGSEKLREKERELTGKLAAAEEDLAAICLAKEVIVRANQNVARETAPEIARYAAGYMETLTGGRYTQLQLTNDLSQPSVSDGDARLDRLRLSTGTRDQMYLALRLALCKVMFPGMPIILDDPFMTFDEDRQARGMELLERLGKERQIILLSSRRL